MNKIEKGSSQRIIFLYGLPGSGKTKFATQYCLDNPNTIRLNKDDIRKEFGNKPFSKSFEKEVLDVERLKGITELTKGFSIIIDDTNFHPKHKTFWQDITIKMNIDFEEIFIDTPLEECIKRDKERENSVGEKVIRGMFNRYLKMKDDLVSKGCIQAKTHFITFPSIDIVPIHLQTHFIRGYFDGDGCITGKISDEISRLEISIVSNKKLLDGIQDIMVNNCGFTKTMYNKRHKEKDDEIYTLIYGGPKNIFMFYKWIYKDATIFMDRKKEKFITLLTQYTEKIRKVTNENDKLLINQIKFELNKL